MDLKGYEYGIAANFRDYIFESIGPKGVTKKIVIFTRVRGNLFNLSLSDEEIGNSRNKKVVSGNNDLDKVLQTVALIVHDFIITNPGAIVVASGHTDCRNRLYRMAISRNLNKISGDYKILGYNEGAFTPFEPNTQYQSFLIYSMNKLNFKI